MKNKFLIPLIAIFAICLLFGTAYSAWAFDNVATVSNNVQVEFPGWGFDGDDYIDLDNVSNLSYLTASRETSIVSPDNGSVEAVRFTNTAGTQTKDHSFIVALDQEYVLRNIKTYKVEFDYYHAEKRQQTGKGFPKVRLMYNTSGKGNTHGGGETITDKSPFIATSLNNNWWHLEYFVTSLCPTFADHGDSGINENTKINGVQIIDNAIYDYSGNTAFIVVDNFRFDNTLAPRLGLFNAGTSFKMSKGYYWMKICWAGTLNSCTMTFSDPTIAEQDTASVKSPFYVHALQPGIVTVTATLDLGEQHQRLSISNEITITDN